MRAMIIIFPGSNYKTLPTIHGIDTLCSHREELIRRFFVRHAQNETCCFNYLLPPKRDITAKLKNTRLPENIKVNTKRFSNFFISYSMKNFQ